MSESTGTPPRRPRRHAPLRYAALLLASGIARAASPEFAAVLRYSALADVDLRDTSISAEALGYESPQQRVPGFRIDLNHDGMPELVLRAGPKFCGTGGCSLFLFDGAGNAAIGMLFGNTVVVNATAIHGWSVLTVYARGGVTSGTYSTFVHDGREYVRVSAVHLRTDSVKDLFDTLQSAPAETARR